MKLPALAALACCLSGCGSAPAGGPDGGAAGSPDAAFSPETLHFTTGDWEVPPGSEPTRCLFTRLQSTTDFLITGYRATMTPGSHHFNMFYLDADAPGAGDHELDVLTYCDYGYAFYLAGSQWQSIDQQIPNGLAIRIPAGALLVLESHYVNATDEPMAARVDVEFDRGDPAVITNLMGLYFNILENIQLDPGQRVRLRGRCPADPGVKLALLTSHTHWHSESFEINLIDEASGAATPLYLSEDYAHPKTVTMWDDPVEIGDGQLLEWACNYNNTTDQPVLGGGSAERDEMCIMAAYYWPMRDGVQPYCIDGATATPPL